MKALFSWIESIHFLMWERIVRSTHLSYKSLCVFRVIVGLFFLLIITPSFSWISRVPNALFSPPPLSLGNLFNGFPNTLFFTVVDTLAIVSLLCFTLGIKARISTVFFLVACLLGLSFQYSFGKVDHENLIYALLLCMLFSNWGTKLALWPDKVLKTEWTNMSLAVLSVFICFGMFTAGIGKALAWVDFDLSTNGFLGWSQRAITDKGHDYLLSVYVASFPAFLLEAVDYVAVIFELSPFFFLLYSRRAWRCWLLIACFFHLGNTLFLNIPFISHSLLYLIFIDFSWLYNKINALFSIKSLKIILISSMAIVVVIRLAFFVAHPSPLYGDSYSAKVNTGVIVWILSIIILLKSLTIRSVKFDHSTAQAKKFDPKTDEQLMTPKWIQYLI